MDSADSGRVVRWYMVNHVNSQSKDTPLRSFWLWINKNCEQYYFASNNHKLCIKYIIISTFLSVLKHDNFVTCVKFGIGN